MMQFNTVQKWYGGTLALDIPSLSLDKGVYWLQGENGSGKTTFLKMINGLHPFDGDILIGEDSIKKNRMAFMRRVNYAEAEALYPPFLTAKDLVALYCSTMKSKVQDTCNLLETLHIMDAYSKPLGAWSSGMTKKLSLALAFTGDPEWILLDEPLITVDVDAVAIISELINMHYTQNSVSFILTSHQPFQEDVLHITKKMMAQNKTVMICND